MKELRKILLFVKPYWKLAVLSMILLLAMVAMDLSIPRLIQRIIDQGIRQNNSTVVTQTALLMLGITLLSAAAAVGNNIFSIRAGESVARDLREALFLKIQRFSYGDLDHYTTGNLMVRLSSDTAAVQRLVQITLRIGTRGPLMMIGSMIFMVVTSPQLALTLLPLLLVISVILIFFSTRMEPLFRSVQQKLDRLNTVLQENISGARLIKAFVRADHEGGRFEDANEDFTARNIRVMQLMSGVSPILTIFVNLGMVGVIWFGGLQTIEGQMSLGEIVAFSNYLMTTMGPLTMMSALANVWANGLASSQRIQEVLEHAPEVPEDPQALPMEGVISPEVVFENVGFHYNGSTDTPVLNGINLTARPGETVAILGATGAGKTSLINLIPRYYDVSAGRVLVDGVDVHHYRQEDLMANVGIVPQETILFSGTVRDNIRYGRADASDAEVEAAARAAQAHDFILNLPDGYDTRVEERGVNLSGGQKQRIAIARALLMQPRILILDDSTSSVDVETETKIQKALDEIMRGRTSFIVAQRISTVLNADKIIVLDMGTIAAEGTHASLMQSSPIYREIYDSQLGSGFSEAVNG